MTSVEIKEVVSNLVTIIRAKGDGTKGAGLKAVGPDVFLMCLDIGAKRNTAVFIVIHCSTSQKGAGTDSGRNITFGRKSIEPEDSIFDKFNK